MRKRDNGNESKLEVMRYTEVGKDNKYIRKKQLLAEQKQNPKCFKHIEKINLLLLSDGNANDNNNSNSCYED